MADTCSPQALPPGHLQSPLFKLIPTELRLSIYRHTFAGSEMVLQIQPDAPRLQPHPLAKWLPSPSALLPVGGRRSVFCTSGRYLKYQLLFTCRQIYDEALDIYWSETIVCNHEKYFSRALFFERVPDFAKLHIKHLRDVQTGVNPGAKALRGIASSRQASFAEALDAFPNLQTCSIRDGTREKRPSMAVEEALIRHPKVHLLKTYYEIDRYDEDSWWPHIDWTCKRVYMNFTTGMEYTATEHMCNMFTRMDQEENFQHVMELQSSDKAGGNGEP
ncbi:hypothetical protein LA080_007241 [Diaporthe eres]|nr:hypothetical protein LA080_007241 [Diaporthe eres]